MYLRVTNRPTKVGTGLRVARCELRGEHETYANANRTEGKDVIACGCPDPGYGYHDHHRPTAVPIVRV